MECLGSSFEGVWFTCGTVLAQCACSVPYPTTSTRRRPQRPVTRRGSAQPPDAVRRRYRAWIVGAATVVLLLLGLHWAREREPANDSARQPRPADETSKHERSAADVAHVPGRQSVTRSAVEPSITLRAGPARISGSVVDAEGGPIIGALLTLRSPKGAEPLASAVSDAEGQWELNGPEGEAVLFTRAEAYADVFSKVVAPSAGLTIVLARASSIHGRVIDEAAEPVVGVNVLVRSASNPNEPIHMLPSDAAGRFRVPGLLGGNYEVSASSAQWASAAALVSVDVGTNSDEIVLVVRAATRVSVVIGAGGEPCRETYVSLTGPSGEQTRFSDSGNVTFDGIWPGQYVLAARCPGALDHEERVVVDTAPVRVERDLDKGLSVSGRVQTEQGNAVAGAVVQVRALDAQGADGSCTSDDLGEFTCSGLTAGEYDCAVELNGEPVTDVVRVSVAGRVHGVVLHARSMGNLEVSLEPGGNTQASVYVRAERIGVREGTRQGADKWLFEGLPLGSYDVYAERPDPESTQRVELEHDGEFVRVALRTPPALAIGGTLLTADGNPVIGTWVHASSAEALWGDSTASSTARVLTDDAGRFELAGLATGMYDLHAENSTGSGHQRQVAAGSRAVIVQFESGAELAAHVRDAAGEPAKVFALTFQRAGENGTVVSGRNGRWQASNLSPGTYLLTASAAGASARREVMLSAGSHMNVDLELQASNVEAAD